MECSFATTMDCVKNNLSWVLGSSWRDDQRAGAVKFYARPNNPGPPSALKTSTAS